MLSEKTVLIEGIRETDLNPGIQEYEAKFLKLMEMISNGTKV